MAMSPSTGRVGNNRGINALGLDKPDVDLKKLLYLGNDTLVNDEYDHVIVRLYDDVVMGHENLIVIYGLSVIMASGLARVPADDRADRRAFWQIELLDAPSDNFRGSRIAVRYKLERFRCTAAQRMDRSAVATPYSREQCAYRRLRRRDGDVDVAALHQIHVGASIDEGNHLPHAHTLREQRAHDVVF